MSPVRALDAKFGYSELVPLDKLLEEYREEIAKGGKAPFPDMNQERRIARYEGAKEMRKLAAGIIRKLLERRTK